MNMTEMSKQIKTSFGQWLKEERTAQKISLEEISIKTSIRPSILRAIETEAHEKLPAKVYTVGFLRTYAREVGLDPEEVVKRYHLHWDSEADEKKRPNWELAYETYTETNQRFRRFFLLVTGVVLMLAVWWGYFWLWPQIATRLPAQFFIGTPQPETEKAESATLAVTNAKATPDVTGVNNVATGPAAEPAGKNIAVKEGSNLHPGDLRPSEKKKPEPADDDETVPEPMPSLETVVEKLPELTKTVAVGSNGIASETASRQPSENGSMDLSSGFDLNIEAVAPTWMRITLDSGPAEEYMLRSGDQKEFRVSSRIKLFVGNAGGIKLNVNGAPYPFEGKSGQVLRMTIP